MISDLIAKFEAKFNELDKSKQQEFYKKMDLDFNVKTAYYKVNSESFASGLIPLEISQFVYSKLNDYNKTTLTERFIINQLMSELIQKRLNK